MAYSTNNRILFLVIKNTQVKINYMAINRILQLDLSEASQYEACNMPVIVLKWKKNQLWVKSGIDNARSIYDLPVFKDRSLLIQVLRKSPVDFVHLDRDLGIDEINLWIDACNFANKKVRLNISPSGRKFKSATKLVYWIRRSCDYLLGILILFLLSPIILAISALMVFYVNDSVLVTEWRVGHRGKLFKLYTFRTSQFNSNQFVKNSLDRKCDPSQKNERLAFLSQWLHKYNLVNIPQLFNVVKGEMSLIGYPALNVTDALQGSSEKQKRLNSLPGLIHIGQVFANPSANSPSELSKIAKYTYQ